MAKSQKDARLMEYKDIISQLNMTVKSQNEIILSLRDTIASNQEQMRTMTEQIEYLTKKLFGTSSEKTKNLEGQYNLFDEAEQEAIPVDETETAGAVPVKGSKVFLPVMKSYHFPKIRSFALIAVLKGK